MEGISGNVDHHGKEKITVKMLDTFLSERVKELTGGRVYRNERRGAMMKGWRTWILVLVLLFIFGMSSADLFAQQPKRGVKVEPKTGPSLDEFYAKSYAVIVGINKYEKWPGLEYAVSDAQVMEERLKEQGFQTITLIDHQATRENVVKVLGDDLPRQVGPNDRVIIFFAGHGQTEELPDRTQMGYLIPVDGDTRDLFSTAISMEQVRAFSRRLVAKHVFYIIDSCYSGLGLSRSGTIPPSERDYLRKITSRKAHQMLTAGGKGEQAREEGGHGIFTKYILEAIAGAADREGKGYVTFSDIAAYVRPKVTRYSQNAQTPQYGSIDGEGEFVFMLGDSRRPLETAAAAELGEEKKRLEEERHRLEEEKARMAALRQQVEEERRLEEERKRLEAERRQLEEEQKRREEERRQAMGRKPPAAGVALPLPAGPFTDPVTGMEFVFVKGGCFQMGDTFGDGNSDEKPVHEACVDDFYLGKYEVTQGQWQGVMGSNPSYFKECGVNCPVEQVSWNDVQEFISRLNQRSGRRFRLPTEAEWEYAARSGGKAEKWSGTSSEGELGQYAWYSGNSDKRTHPVGEKRPNGLGLYDMAGNVWEWCADWYGGNNYYQGSPRNNPEGPGSGSTRVIRGGSWKYDVPWNLRSAYRAGFVPANWDTLHGFRLGVSAR